VAMRLLALVAVAFSAQPSLAKVLLTPAQVGPGYVLQVPADGQGTKQRTLDLCGTKGYPSEALRVERLQVDYVRLNAPFRLSNEVVRYKPGGAAQAIREVAQHARTCPKKPIAFEGNPPLRYELTRLDDAKLVKGYIALRERITGIYNGKHLDRTIFVSYQRIGNVLSAVYSYPAGPGVSADAQQRFFLNAAEQGARDLRAATHKGGVPA
jgi:hypothetical protein